MRIVTLDAIAVSHRFVDVLLEQEVATLFVAGEAEFLFLSRKRELVVCLFDHNVANGTGTGTDGTVDPGCRAHGRVAIGADTVIVSPSRIGQQGDGQETQNGSKRRVRCKKCHLWLRRRSLWSKSPHPGRLSC